MTPIPEPEPQTRLKVPQKPACWRPLTELEPPAERCEPPRPGILSRISHLRRLIPEIPLRNTANWHQTPSFSQLQGRYLRLKFRF